RATITASRSPTRSASMPMPPPGCAARSRPPPYPPPQSASKTRVNPLMPGEGRVGALRVGIDVGGTFTDVTAFDEDRGELIAVRKYLSDPARPAAVMDTITQELARDFGANAVSLILHGSTAALNTLLEGKGVRTGLITTRGF